MEQETVASRILQCLEDNDISQADFSRETGIPYSMTSQYVRGKHLPNAGNLQKIAQYFGVRMEWLLLGLEPKAEATDCDNALLSLMRSLNQYQQTSVLRHLLRLHEETHASDDPLVDYLVQANPCLQRCPFDGEMKAQPLIVAVK